MLVIAVPAAAFAFGRLVPDGIRSRGGFAVALPGLALASSFLLWRCDVRPRWSLLAGASAAGAAAVLSILGPRLLGRRSVPPLPPAEAAAAVEKTPPRSWLPVAVVLFLLFAAAFRFYWRPHTPVDLFEDGHLLAPAQGYLAGAAPYQDTYPVHGWGADGGLDAVAFRLLAPTLEVMRARRALAAAVGVAAVALACWALFRRPLWSAAAFALAMSLCPFLAERHAPAFLGLAALIWAAETGRRRAWLAAGIASAATVFYALDLGLMLLAAGLLTAASLAVLEGGWKPAARAAAWLASGALLASLPFLGILASSGAADDFVRVSFFELPSRISDIWSVPASTPTLLLQRGRATDVLGELLHGRTVPWLFHAGLLALAATLLLFRAARRELSSVDRGAVAATWMAIVAMRGALGRADDGHLLLYGVFTALPAAWLLFRAARAPHAAWLLAPAFALALVVRVEPQRLPAIAWNGLVHTRPGPGDCLRALPRSGAATVPCSQSEEMRELRAWLDRELAPDQTFFDFGNEPALYFLMDRRPPVRYCCVPFYEGESHEREVIAALERERPPVAILASGTFLDALDTVSNRDRTPLVAEYLDRTYEPAGRVGTRLLGRRRSGR